MEEGTGLAEELQGLDAEVVFDVLDVTPVLTCGASAAIVAPLVRAAGGAFLVQPTAAELATLCTDDALREVYANLGINDGFRALTTFDIMDYWEHHDIPLFPVLPLALARDRVLEAYTNFRNGIFPEAPSVFVVLTTPNPDGIGHFFVLAFFAN